MEKSKCICIGVLIVLIHIFRISNAQQLPLYTQYREATAFLNPAAFNMDGLAYDFRPKHSFKILARRQWHKLKDGPQTYFAGYNRKFSDHNMQLGGFIFRDQTGPLTNSVLQLRFTYQIFLNDVQFISIGIGPKLYQYLYSSKNVELQHPNDPIASVDDRTGGLSLSAGLSYYLEMANYDVFVVGMSVPQLYNPHESHRPVRHYYINADYFYFLGNQLSEEDFIQFSIWGRYTKHSPISYNINIKAQVMNLIWVGIGYNGNKNTSFSKTNSTEVNFEAGYILHRPGRKKSALKVGGSFGLGLQGINSIFGNTADINISYSFE